MKVKLSNLVYNVLGYVNVVLVLLWNQQASYIHETISLFSSSPITHSPYIRFKVKFVCVVQLTILPVSFFHAMQNTDAVTGAYDKLTEDYHQIC